MPDTPKPDTPKPDTGSKAREIEELVEDWFFRSFHGSVVARATEVWNHVHAAKEELKQRLAALLAPPARD